MIFWLLLLIQSHSPSSVWKTWKISFYFSSVLLLTGLSENVEFGRVKSTKLIICRCHCKYNDLNSQPHHPSWLSDVLIWIWCQSLCQNDSFCVSSATWSGTGVVAVWQGKTDLDHESGTGWRGTPSGAVCVCMGAQWTPSHLPPARRPPPLLRQTWSWCSAPPLPRWRSCAHRGMDRDSTFSFTET